jgi:hypothetical protein
MLRLKKVQKRFTAQFVDDTSLEISFGAGTTGTADELIIPNPYNVGIGYNAGYSSNGDNNTILGSQSANSLTSTFCILFFTILIPL